MRIGTLVTLVVFFVMACGSSDDPSAGEKACQDLAAKLAQCRLMATCNASQPCAVGCAAQAECSQLTAPPAGTYLSCLAACSGAGPDDFICKDRSGYLNKAGVCDGRSQCPDGSDEANCGSSDAGTD